MEESDENKKGGGWKLLGNILHNFFFFIYLGTILIYLIKVFPGLDTSATIFAIYLIIMTTVWSLYSYSRVKEIESKSKETIKEESSDKQKTIDYQKNLIQNCELENRKLLNRVEELEHLPRQSKYADALVFINYGFAHINDSHRIHLRHNSISSKAEANLYVTQLVKEFGELCSMLERAFGVITQSKCSVCIKLLANTKKTDLNNSKVYTLTRDSAWGEVRNHPKDKDVKHWVKDNSSYSYVFGKLGNPNGRSFINNNLPLDWTYKTSSFKVYEIPKVNNLMSDAERLKAWTLPYKSTIVTAICPNISGQFNRDTLLGFICVDSEHMDAFPEEYDKILMEGTADGIYNSIKLFRELMESQKLVN